MSAIETVLIFVGIPGAVVAAIYGVVYAGSSQRGRRYRPGRAFTFRPVWYLSAAGAGSAAAGTAAALPAGHRGEVPALPAAGGADPAGEWPADDSALRGATGGASDTW